MQHGQSARAAFPQWERDYNLQPMNNHGLFDEYLEMSACTKVWDIKVNWLIAEIEEEAAT